MGQRQVKVHVNRPSVAATRKRSGGARAPAQQFTGRNGQSRLGTRIVLWTAPRKRPTAPLATAGCSFPGEGTIRARLPCLMQGLARLLDIEQATTTLPASSMLPTTPLRRHDSLLHLRLSRVAAVVQCAPLPFAHTHYVLITACRSLRVSSGNTASPSLGSCLYERMPGSVRNCSTFHAPAKPNHGSYIGRLHSCHSRHLASAGWRSFLQV